MALPPAVIASIAMGGVQAGMSIISGFVQKGRVDDAREALANLPIPDASKFYLDGKLMESARMGDPEIFNAVIQGPSAMEGISEDPRLRAAQMQEIAGMEQLATTGETPQMAADLAKAQTQLGTQMRGAREAALQSMASRGMSGSGLEAAMQASTNQAATQAASQAGTDIAATQANRRMQALQGLGGAAGRMRGQEFGQAATKASAADEIAARNVGARNQGQMFNIQNQMATNKFNAQQSMREAEARARAEEITAQMKYDQAKSAASMV